MEAAATSAHTAEVDVSLTITDEDGATQVEEETIDGGPTPVPHLKSELGVPVESALWVVQRNGKKKQLAITRSTTSRRVIATRPWSAAG